MTNEHFDGLTRRVKKQHGPQARLVLTETHDSEDGPAPQYSARVSAPGIAAKSTAGQSADDAVRGAIDAAHREMPGEPFPLP